MKKLLVLAAAAMSLASAANAELAGPAWACQIKGKLSGQSVGVGLSVTDISGAGVINCTAMNGVKVQVPVKLKLTGIGVGLGFTEYGDVEIVSATVGLADGPKSLVGSWSVGPTAGVTLIEAGLNVGAAVKISKDNGLGVDLALLGSQGKGLEAKLQLQALEITQAE